MTSEQPSRSRRLSRAWAVLAITYAVFFYWYTSFEGPLRADEIAHFTEVLEEAPVSDETRERWIGFMQSDTGGDFAMWNAVDFLETPKPIEGVDPGETGQEVASRYADPFFAMAFRRASHPVMGGDAAGPALEVWGIEGGEDWDSGLLVRYRSRRDIMELMEAMATSGTNIHDFKIAALAKTIAFPLDPWGHTGDPRLLLALVFLVVGLAMQLRHNARTGPREA